MRRALTGAGPSHPAHVRPPMSQARGTNVHMETNAVVWILVALLTVVLVGLVVAVWLLTRRLGAGDARGASALAERTDEQLMETFRSLAGQAMAEQSAHLVEVAGTSFEGLNRTTEARWNAQSQTLLGRLESYNTQLVALEKERKEDSGAIRSALEALRQHTREVQAEAANLAAALKDNSRRGLWGEVQLRRALESAGMMAHADFVEQAAGVGERNLRPDVVVHLPNSRTIVVDAKAPLDAFLRASQAGDEEQRRAALDEHAAALVRHIKTLSSRDYAHNVDGSVDFVVLFIPGDAYLSAAIEARPELLEHGWSQQVLLATPTSLIGLLRGVALGWRERRITERAEQIAALGAELHERVAIVAEHMGQLGGSIGRSVTAYNSAVSSMESRLLVTARRFEELGADSGRALPDTPQLDTAPRQPDNSPLREPHSAA